jgi:sigma-B regulation protein RsbU (phosphoserine phosphatase)
MLRQVRAIGELQRHLLPRAVPDLPGWQVAVHYEVGSWPGGDYYDFLPLPDGRLLLLIADGSDQGAPAVALTAMMRVLLHSCPLSSGTERLPFCPMREPIIQPPHILLGHLNRALAENSLEEQFVTAFCGVLDPVDGNFHYANATHPVPRWWRAGQRVVEPLPDTTGLPLGVDGHASYHHKRVQFDPGDVLVLYSDGLLAALNDEGRMFGCERLDAALRRSAGEGPEGVKAAVVGDFRDFLLGREPQDDVTLVVVHREE